MKFVNLTPHPVVVRPSFDPSQDPIAREHDEFYAPSMARARIDQSSEMVADLNGVPVRRPVYGDIVDLPDPEPGTIYIAALIVAQMAAERGRADVVSPDTSPNGGAIRNGGQIYAVRGFQTFAKELNF